MPSPLPYSTGPRRAQPDLAFLDGEPLGLTGGNDLLRAGYFPCEFRPAHLAAQPQAAARPALRTRPRFLPPRSPPAVEARPGLEGGGIAVSIESAHADRVETRVQN